jgi:hypothetical protein
MISAPSRQRNDAWLAFSIQDERAAVKIVEQRAPVSGRAEATASSLRRLT